MIEQKDWGTRERIFLNDTTTVDRLQIVKGGYCSNHFHRHKRNWFYILTGKLKISLGLSGIGGVILGPAESYCIPIDLTHNFEALEEVVCIEISSQVDISEDDIVRFDKSGVKKDVT